MRRLTAVLALSGLALPAAQAQMTDAQAAGATAPTGLSIRPRIGLTEAWTDNLMPTNQQGQLSPKDAALITTLSPGVNIVSPSGRIRGSLDYALNGIAYLKSDQRARVQNALSAQATAELIDRAVFVDARAAISQQAVSAFGLQTADSTLANPNQREVMTASLMPSWRGVVGAAMAFELQAVETRTQVRNSELGDGHSEQATLRLSAAHPGPVSPSFTLMTQHGGFSGHVGPSRLSSAVVAATYRADADWRLGVSAGAERSNLLSSTAANGSTYGLTADWTPTPRTQVGADWQHHSYGESHSLSVSHRLSRLSLKLSDMRGINLGSTAAGGVRTNYELFFQLFASQEPDPVKRDQLVRSYLQQQGLSPDAPVNGGFLSAGPSRLHSQQFSVAMRGVRSSLTATLARTQTRRIGAAPVEGDLAVSGLVDQRSFNLSLAHQLTAASSLSIGAAKQLTRGDGPALSNSLSSLTASWNARLGQRLSMQLGLRHSRVTGPLAYGENSAQASLTQQF